MKSKTMIRYRADHDLNRAVRVECPDGLYPNRDADGKMIYVNTHYETESEAWEDVRINAELRVKFAGDRIVEIEKQLTAAHIEAGVAAVKYGEMRDNFAEANQ